MLSQQCKKDVTSSNWFLAITKLKIWAIYVWIWFVPVDSNSLHFDGPIFITAQCTSSRVTFLKFMVSHLYSWLLRDNSCAAYFFVSVTILLRISRVKNNIKHTIGVCCRHVSWPWIYHKKGLEINVLFWRINMGPNLLWNCHFHHFQRMNLHSLKNNHLQSHEINHSNPVQKEWFFIRNIFHHLHLPYLFISH